MRKISIVIPVYNLENYISRCLDSIFSQGLDEKDYEVVIVDDGSTDRSADVIKSLLRPNCIYLKQENSRQGSARNNGVMHSSGKYIWYVDGDDVIAPNSLKKIIDILEENKDLDVLFFSIIRRYETHDDLLGSKIKSEFYSKIFTGKDYLALRKLSLGPWYVFKRQMLLDNNIFFMEKVFFEDSEYMPKVCFFAKQVMYANISPYIAFSREDSTTKTASLCHVNDLIKVFTSMSEFAIKNKSSDSFSDLCYYASMVFNTMFSRYRNLLMSDKCKVFIPSKSKKDIIRCMLNSGHNKYIFEAIFLKLFWKFIFF